MKNLVTLAELFPDKQLRCGVPGCRNLCTSSPDEKEGGAPSSDQDAGESIKMCDRCRELYAELEDQEQPCANPECNKTWVWTRYSRLKARVDGKTKPPPGLCPDCMGKLEDMEDKEIPCRVRGCQNTWRWTRKQQVMHPGNESSPRPLCSECRDTLQRLSPRDVTCRVNGCQNTWKWNVFHQLEHMKAGKSVEHPPKRMCEDCYQLFHTLTDKQIPCKIEECAETWTYTAFAQLQDRRTGGDEAQAPKRMCDACFAYFQKTEPKQVQCATPGCRRTWTYTKRMQLRDWHKGRQRPPKGHCEQCKQDIQRMEERQVSCAVPGCTGTWTYPPAAQLKDRRLRRGTPGRRCDACNDFLAQHHTKTLTCTACGSEFQWSGYEQLLYERGAFTKPQVCTDCQEKKRARYPHANEKAGYTQVIRIPPKGRWQQDQQIANWPLHVDHTTVERAEKADVRIVAFGDDLTFSNPEFNKSWPALLEQYLNQDESMLETFAVVNAGIVGTDSVQAVKRLKRDVIPFAPHLVIFSFAFGDSQLTFNRAAGAWELRRAPADIEKGVDELYSRLSALNTALVHWTTNPIRPFKGFDAPAADHHKWADERQKCKNWAGALHLRHCHARGLTSLDLRSRFEINGERTMKKWMADWYRHNETGAQYIARWFADHITHHECDKLLADVS